MFDVPCKILITFVGVYSLHVIRIIFALVIHVYCTDLRALTALTNDCMTYAQMVFIHVLYHF